MSVLHPQQIIEDRYTVDYLIKQSAYCETYRVSDIEGKPLFMKVYILKCTPPCLITDDGLVAEISYLCKLRHNGINEYVAHGAIAIPSGVAQYLVARFFTGELLADRLQREGPLPQREAVQIMTTLLNTLQYLHSQHLLHNDITPRNVMLTSVGPKLIDMGHMSGIVMGVPPFDTADLDLHYCSTPSMAGLYTQMSDIFSVVAVFYTMLTGHAPWPVSLDECHTRHDCVKALRKARKAMVNLNGVPVELMHLVARGLRCLGNEFTNVDDVKQELLHPTRPRDPDEPAEDRTPTPDNRNGGNNADPFDTPYDDDEHTTTDSVEIRRGNGNGFADIGGMADLKDMLQKRVVFVLKDRERAERYRLTTPNGMLLYGPPGCGKSFFAEKFAEETGFNFMFVKSSDLGSVYIHGSQGKIAALFRRAEQNAPIVICFDEFDAFVPQRNNEFDNKQAGEVNEFLTQLNNCCDRGIFVIATSNRPDMIDPAVLRTGRIDKQVYVPLPDYDARREILALQLKGRPLDRDIDFEELSRLTEGYVSSDLKFVVNEAAMVAAFNDTVITQQLLVATIGANKPSVRPDVIKQYDAMRERFESISRTGMPSVGFKVNPVD